MQPISRQSGVGVSSRVDGADTVSGIRATAVAGGAAARASRRLRGGILAAAALALAVTAPMLLPGCASGFGGDFLTDKHSNLTLKSFETVSSGTGGSGGGTSGTGGTSGGSSSASNGGPTGPSGGNPTEFQVRFDPFPTVSSPATAIGSRTVLIEVTIGGHDLNGNVIRVVSFMPASGRADSSTQSGTGATSSGGVTSGGETISTLRPVLTDIRQATSFSQTTTDFTTATGDATTRTSISGTITQQLLFPTTVAARMSITNGISVWLDSITLRYFEADGSLAPFSAYALRLSTFLEANPVATGFSTSAGGK